MVHNWMGQEFKVNDPVFRGARDGNSSEFKVGRVCKVDNVKNEVQIEWLYAKGHTAWLERWLPASEFGDFQPVARLGSKGYPNPDSLCIITEDILDNLEMHAQATEQYEQECYRIRDRS